MILNVIIIYFIEREREREEKEKEINNMVCFFRIRICEF